MRGFATKNKDESDAEGEAPVVKKRRGRPPKAKTVDAQAEATPEKKPRATRAKKAAAASEEGVAEETKKAPVKRTRKKKTAANEQGAPIKMYVLKFNSPILPYAKFPLTHNRYI